MHATSTPFEQQNRPSAHDPRSSPHTQRPPSHRSDALASHPTPQAPQSAGLRSRSAQYPGLPGERPGQHQDCRLPTQPRVVAPQEHWLALQRSPRWLAMQSISQSPQCRGSLRRLAQTVVPSGSRQHASSGSHSSVHIGPASRPASRTPASIPPSAPASAGAGAPSHATISVSAVSVSAVSRSARCEEDANPRRMSCPALATATGRTVGEGTAARREANRGADRSRTGEWRFCKPLPYHLATAPASPNVFVPATKGGRIPESAQLSSACERRRGRDAPGAVRGAGASPGSRGEVPLGRAQGFSLEGARGSGHAPPP